MILLTIVVPIYNVEKYLNECLQSIVALNDINYEVILINDGSTDKSKDIAQKYVDMYEQFNMINRINGGLSSSRNLGLDNASGKYITFVDSDDFVDAKILKNLVLLMESKDLDIIRGKYKLYYNDNLIKDLNEKYDYEDEVISGVDLISSYLKTNSYQIVSCTSLYKRSYLIKSSIKYFEGIYFEDHDFTLKVLLDKQIKVMQTDERYYYYRQREGSITKSANLNMVRDLIKVMELQTSFLNNQEEELRVIGQQVKLISLSHLIQFSYYFLSKRDINKISKELKRKKHLYKGFFRTRYNKKQKYKIILFLHFNNSLNYFYKLLKKERFNE